LIFQLTVFTYPQIKNFQISQDKAPSTFNQQYPQLYPDRGNGYIIVWEDSREGESSYYAQAYDSLNQPVGKNFKINAKEQLYFSSGNYISLKTVSTDYSYLNTYFPDYFQVIGSIYNKENVIIKDINLAGGVYPECAMGYLGTQQDMITTDSNFIFFFMDNGAVTAGRYDYAGNSISNFYPLNSRFPSGQSTYGAAGAISADINNNGNYLLGWFNARADSLPIGYYGTMFNSKDSVIGANKLLLQYSIDSTNNTYFMAGHMPYIKVKAVSDSLFEVFFIRTDSLKIVYAKYNENGSLIGNINSIDIPHYISGNTNDYYALSTPSFVPLNKNSFGLLFTTNTYTGNLTKNVNSIFYFDKDGNRLESFLTDTTLNYNFVNGISLQGTDSFVIPVNEKGDIYLKQYKNFIAVDSLKVNDDLSGANQLNSFVEKVNNNKYLSGWQEESGIKGRFIDINGTNVSDIFDIPGYAVKYFNDGSSIVFWKKQISDSYCKLGFSILDQNQQIISNDSLLFDSDSYRLNADVNIISDSLFMIICGNYSGAKIASFNKKGGKLNEYTLTGEYSNNVHIYTESQDSIWASWSGKIQLFSGTLKPISQISIITPSLYLGNNKFLLITAANYYGNNYYQYTATILNPAMDTIRSNIPLAYNTNEISTSNLTKDRFLVMYKSNNRIFEKTFFNNGNIVQDSIQIDDGISSYKKLPCMAANNSKVIFTWSDARNSGNGYDIYGSIWDLSRIMSVRKLSSTVPSSFYLSQNYPNPFNPSTKIRFSVPSTIGGNVNVQIKVCDILGKEIITLLNEDKTAGTYELEFNTQSGNGLKNLSSGIYFYKMEAGNFSETKKFILIK
jgi:hypothetical protein